MAAYVDNVLSQFENTNALRTYPFADGSSLVDRIGRELSRDVVVDAHLVVPCDGAEQCVVKMTSLHMSPCMVSACFLVECGGKRNAMSVTVAVSSLSPYSPVRLEKLSGSEDVGGIVTFGDFSLPGSPETYFFDNAVIQDCCIARALPAPLRKFTDPRSGESVSGDVKMSFSGYISASRDGRMYSLSIDDAAATELASECSKSGSADACGATPIRSINGVRPDSHGNIVLWFH